jgi:hypothetical protein
LKITRIKSASGTTLGRDRLGNLDKENESRKWNSTLMLTRLRPLFFKRSFFHIALIKKNKSESAFSPFQHNLFSLFPTGESEKLVGLYDNEIHLCVRACVQTCVTVTLTYVVPFQLLNKFYDFYGIWYEFTRLEPPSVAFF